MILTSFDVYFCVWLMHILCVYVSKLLSGFFGTRCGCFWRTQHSLATLIITPQLRPGTVDEMAGTLKNASGNLNVPALNALSFNLVSTGTCWRLCKILAKI